MEMDCPVSGFLFSTFLQWFSENTNVFLPLKLKKNAVAQHLGSIVQPPVSLVPQMEL
jgi:hypothetical protein